MGFGRIKGRVFWGVAFLLLVGGAVFWGYAAKAKADGTAGMAGGAADPLVTKSYVDQAINQAKGALQGQIGDLAQKVTALQNTVGQNPGGTGWQVMELQAGKVVTAQGGTALIVRVGKAVVVAPNAGIGIPDVTGGADLLGGKVVPLNHELIVPSTDGRGLKILSHSYIMVQGRVTVN